MTKAPTCTEKGEKTFTCANDATHTRTEEIAALGHKWDEGKVTKAPTCTEKGEKTFTCANDATHTRTEEIAAKGHTESGWKIGDTQHWKVCTECKKTIDGTKANHVDKDNNRWCDVCGVSLAKADLEDTPGTGDETPLGLLTVLMVLSAAGICVVLLYCNRKKLFRV